MRASTRYGCCSPRWRASRPSPSIETSFRVSIELCCLFGHEPDTLQFGSDLFPCCCHIERILQVEPQFRRGAERLGQPQGRIGSDADRPGRESAVPSVRASRGSRYCLAGGPKSSGGRSICGTSILTLFRSTLAGLSSRPVTVIGNAITINTIRACRPTQGRAPQ